MSADILRRAASLMRERAEAAPSAPWIARSSTNGDPANGPTLMVVENDRGIVSEHDYDRWGGTSADHIASWHPAVALAVADLLDEAALTVEVMGPWDWDYPEGPMDATGSLRPEVRRALAVAQAYLGEAS